MAKVRAIKDKQTVLQIAELLRKHNGEQYRQIWLFACNVGLRIGDVLAISLDDARRALFRGYVEIKEEKTGKINSFELNVRAKEIINNVLDRYSTDTWLFQSHSNNTQGRNKALSRSAVYQAFREAGEIAGVKIGTHTPRKTRARLLYEAKTPIAVIKEVLNHATENETRAYIDITHEEKQATYHDVVI